MKEVAELGKKKRNLEPPPVETGFDARPWERSAEDIISDKDSEAPDGISGNWT